MQPAIYAHTQVVEKTMQVLDEDFRDDTEFFKEVFFGCVCAAFYIPASEDDMSDM